MGEPERINNYFPALTGLRAIAAFMVYFHHFNPVDKDIFGQTIYNFFTELHVGVTLFFVLSGFLITYRYFNYQQIDFKRYITNRFARIYPMYFLLTTLTFILFAFFRNQNSLFDLKIYFLNITFLKGFTDDFKFSGIGQGWSLTVEEMFYFLAPVLFVFIKKSKYYLIWLPILFILIGFALVAVLGNQNGYGFMKTNNFMLDFSFFGRCIEFFAGISLAIFIKKFKNVKFLTFFGLAMTILSIVILSELKPNESAYGTDLMLGKIINTIFLPLFGFVPLFAGLIYEQTFVSKILKSNLFQILGKSSYVFYLIHMGVFALFLNKIYDNYMFLFIALNLISVVLYKHIEVPLNNFIRK